MHDIENLGARPEDDETMVISMIPKMISNIRSARSYS